MKVIIRYADLSRFEGEWYDAPGYGVQTIAYNDPQAGPILRHGGGPGRGSGDFYRVDDDGAVIAMDYNSLIHYVVDELGLVKVGSMVGQHQWQRIMELGMADRDSLRGGD
jgi:hypothetical protein